MGGCARESQGMPPSSDRSICRYTARREMSIATPVAITRAAAQIGISARTAATTRSYPPSRDRSPATDARSDSSPAAIRQTIAAPMRPPSDRRAGYRFHAKTGSDVEDVGDDPGRRRQQIEAFRRFRESRAPAKTLSGWCPPREAASRLWAAVDTEGRCGRHIRVRLRATQEVLLVDGDPRLRNPRLG